MSLEVFNYSISQLFKSLFAAYPNALNESYLVNELVAEWQAGHRGGEVVGVGFGNVDSHYLAVCMDWLLHHKFVEREYGFIVLSPRGIEMFTDIVGCIEDETTFSQVLTGVSALPAELSDFSGPREFRERSCEIA